MPYLVWGGISLAIGIISYFIPADNLNVATDGLYSSIIGVFQNFTNEFKDKYNNIAKNNRTCYGFYRNNTYFCIFCKKIQK